jgi:hypothetical protein
MTIQLTNIEGISRLSGTDEQGNHWIEFTVDYLAEQSDGVCVECGKGLSNGWMCLDGGDEICADHIEFPGTDYHDRGDPDRCPYDKDDQKG